MPLLRRGECTLVLGSGGGRTAATLDWLLNPALTRTWADVAVVLASTVLDQFSFVKPTLLDGVGKGLRAPSMHRPTPQRAHVGGWVAG